jgi:hypothetical protein
MSRGARWRRKEPEVVAWRRCALAAALACMLASAAAQQLSKERSDAPEPVTLLHQGVRYEAVHWGQGRGLGQNGGYVQAVDPATGSVLWLHRIYAIAYDPAKEQDKQDRFITQLAISERGEALLVGDERGGRYLLDLRTHQVSMPAR